jgi:hypothetical protein
MVPDTGARRKVNYFDGIVANRSDVESSAARIEVEVVDPSLDALQRDRLRRRQERWRLAVRARHQQDEHCNPSCGAGGSFHIHHRSCPPARLMVRRRGRD